MLKREKREHINKTRLWKKQEGEGSKTTYNLIGKKEKYKKAHLWINEGWHATWINSKVKVDRVTFDTNIQ